MTFFALRAHTALALATLIAVAPQSPPPQQPPPQQPPPSPQQQQQQPPQPRQPVFRGGAAFVLVDVYPQQEGRVVEGLTVKDFQVFEDGKPQAIESLEFVRIEPSRNEAARRDPNYQRDAYVQAADPSNRVFIIFLDTGHVSVFGSHIIRKPLIDMLNGLIAETDLFAVMTPAVPPHQMVLGRRMASVEEQLTRHWPWGERNRKTINPDDPDEVHLENCFGSGPFFQEMVNRHREDKTMSALERLAAFAGAIREARTVVIPITDGWRLYRPDTGLAERAGAFGIPSIVNRGGTVGIAGGGTDPYAASGKSSCSSEVTRLAGLDNERRLRDVIALANRTNVSFYPVAASGLAVFDTPIGAPRATRDPTDPTEALVANIANVTQRNDSLKTIAANTDGIAIVDTNDLSSGLKRIANDVSAYYLLGYYSTNTRLDGRFRRIEVKTTRDNVDIKARRGYTAPQAPSEKGAPAPPARSSPSLPDEALAVLARLRTGAELFTYGVAEPGAVQVAIELARGKAGTSPRSVRVQVSGAAGDPIAATGRIEPPVRSTTVRVPLPDGMSGPWKVTVAVEGGPELLHEQTVIGPLATRLLGDPRLFRATSSPRSPIWPVADFQFTRTERVHVEWRLRGELDRREARLLGRDGQPIAVPVTATEREQDGGRVLAIDLQLAPLTAGDYVIEVVAGAGQDTDRRLVPIRITG